MTGSTPRGVTGEQAAGRWVRDMFDRVSPRYDLLNHLLSFNLDRRWRARLVEQVSPVLVRPDARVLDLCCGTGDVLKALERRRQKLLLGSDFSHRMLVQAQQKGIGSPLFESDALMLPLRDGSLDLVTIAFGFRNLANYRKGLEELKRVLKPGGLAAILEFSQPTNRAFGALYGFFSRRVLPWVGGAISGSPEAYAYLPESIKRFPGADELSSEIRAAGFAEVEFERLSAGAVALHVATK